MKELLKSLMEIQQELKAPKNKRNSFGGYNYRSLEDIEDAIKPILKEQKCGIRFDDEIEDHCGRTFLKTTLHFFNENAEITTTAIAEQEPTKKGMDAAQISGAASSYARKYAMNAMFAIDDSKDPDTDEYTKQQKNAKEEKKPSVTAPQPQQPVSLSPNPHQQVAINPTIEEATKLSDISTELKMANPQSYSTPQLNACYLALRATTVAELISTSKTLSAEEFEVIKPLFSTLKKQFQPTK